MRLQKKKIIKKGIKYRNRAIKNRRTKSDKKIKFNKMPRMKSKKN
jgi:hypothetical protein